MGSTPPPELVPAHSCWQVTPGTRTHAQTSREVMGTVWGCIPQQPRGDAQEHGRRAGCYWLPPLRPAPGRALWHRLAILGMDRDHAAREKEGSPCSAEPAPARAQLAPQCCPALTKHRHSPTSWAVQLNTATGGLVLASWPKPSTSVPVWQSPVPRSAAEGRGQGQGDTGAGRAPCTGAAPTEAGSAGGNWFRVSLRGRWSQWSGHREVCYPEPSTHLGPGCSAPLQAGAVGMGPGCGQLPNSSEGLLRASGPWATA